MQFNYRCSDCGQNFDIEPKVTICPTCGRQQMPDQLLRGVLDVELSGHAGRNFDVFDLLPVPRQYFPPIPVGNTPLWRPARLRHRLGFKNLYIKDDGLNPTCSLKDRVSFLVSAFAAQHGINEIVLASTGNAGFSMAGGGAAAGQKVTLFLPAAALAGFLKLMTDIPTKANVVILATGNGLKDNAAAARGISIPNQTINSLNDIFKGS